MGSKKPTYLAILQQGPVNFETIFENVDTEPVEELVNKFKTMEQEEQKRAFFWLRDQHSDCYQKYNIGLRLYLRKNALKEYLNILDRQTSNELCETSIEVNGDLISSIKKSLESMGITSDPLMIDLETMIAKHKKLQQVMDAVLVEKIIPHKPK